MEEIKIGYQGDIGSNSEEVAKQFATKLSVKNKVVFIPLISSKNVVESLENNLIDFGVVAKENSIAGIVEETKVALQNKNFEIVDTIVLPICHCLFKLKNTKIEDIKYIASHTQALRQTANYRKTHFPNTREIEVEDTAISAKNLANEILPSNYAVICRKNAGELYDLDLIAENINDQPNNKTTFIVLKTKGR